MNPVGLYIVNDQTACERDLPGFVFGCGLNLPDPFLDPPDSSVAVGQVKGLKISRSKRIGRFGLLEPFTRALRDVFHGVDVTLGLPIFGVDSLHGLVDFLCLDQICFELLKRFRVVRVNRGVFLHPFRPSPQLSRLFRTFDGPAYLSIGSLQKPAMSPLRMVPDFNRLTKHVTAGPDLGSIPVLSRLPIKLVGPLPQLFNFLLAFFFKGTDGHPFIASKAVILGHFYLINLC